MQLDVPVYLEIDELADLIADKLSMEEAAELIRRIDLSYAEWEFTKQVGDWYAQELAKYEEEGDQEELGEVASHPEADQ